MLKLNEKNLNIQKLKTHLDRKKYFIKLYKLCFKNRTNIKLFKLTILFGLFYLNNYRVNVVVVQLALILLELDSNDFENILIFWYNMFHVSYYPKEKILSFINNFQPKNEYEKSIYLLILGKTYRITENDSLIRRTYLQSLRIKKFPQTFESLAVWYQIQKKDCKKYSYYMDLYFKYSNIIKYSSPNLILIQDFIDYQITGNKITNSSFKFQKQDMKKTLKRNCLSALEWNNENQKKRRKPKIDLSIVEVTYEDGLDKKNKKFVSILRGDYYK